jgi:hypothetical protein
MNIEEKVKRFDVDNPNIPCYTVSVSNHIWLLTETEMYRDLYGIKG